MPQKFSTRCLKAFMQTAIILIGHSMGGLVIKRVSLGIVFDYCAGLTHILQACLTLRKAAAAGEDPHFANIAGRVKCLMFLGTPHQYVFPHLPRSHTVI
jgi:hypothetical protein